MSESPLRSSSLPHTPRRMLRRGAALLAATALLAGAAASVAFARNARDAVSSAIAGTSIATAVPSVALETFKVDPGHSMALFRVIHLGAGPFWGRFDAVSGTITTDSATADGLSFDISIDTNSVNTASAQRDRHLRSPDFFSTKEFPAMTFRSRSARKLEGNAYEVAGDLTIRGVTKPISARVLWTGTAEMGMGRRCGFEASFTIDRGDFGVNYGLENGALGREVQVIVALEGVLAKE